MMQSKRIIEGFITLLLWLPFSHVFACLLSEYQDAEKHQYFK